MAPRELLRRCQADAVQLEAYVSQHEMLQRVRSMIGRQHALDIDEEGVRELQAQRRQLEQRVGHAAAGVAAAGYATARAHLLVHDPELQQRLLLKLLDGVVHDARAVPCTLLDDSELQRLLWHCAQLLQTAQRERDARLLLRR